MPNIFTKLEFQREPAILICLGAATGLLTVYGYHKISEFKESIRLQALTKRKQAERQESFTKLRAKYEFTPKRQAIVDAPIDELIEKLQFRILSATEVLQAFIAKSILVTENLNAITEYIPQAHDWAEKLDALPEVKGPLHGLPFCVKDDTDVKGLDTTLGLAKYLYSPANESAALVKTLRDLGGVPMCKTNLPKTLYSYGSENSVWGTTLNSHFPERKMGPGGSSSGSGSLVGAGGCVFGLGSDTGGSGRIPAHFNGISSLKPTIGRICKKGVGMKFLPGCVGVYGVPTLMTLSPKYLALVFKSVLEGDKQRKYDGNVVPVPWNEKMYASHQSLRIGYFTSLPMFPAFGSTQKIVLKAKAALEARGHILVPFQLQPILDPHWIKLFDDFLFADHGEYFREICYGEQQSKAARTVYSNPTYKAPVWIRRMGYAILSWIPISCFQEWSRLLRQGFDADTSGKLWMANTKRDQIIDQVLVMMQNLHLDVILCPAFPFPALRVEDHNRPELFSAIAYTAFWNFVDFPAGIVRFGTESGDDVDSYDDQGMRGPRTAKKAIRNSIGMPIGVQVVGKKFEEELVLRILNELDQSYQIEKAES